MKNEFGCRIDEVRKLISHLIPIPPFAEQKRIVNTIKKIFSEIKGN